MLPKSPIELLSPARNYNVGVAAINHGADAVYIGYDRFGAREAAGNSLVDIEKLVKYAHLFHAKVYITLNTILYENELEEAQKLIKDFYQIGADALIIQDMGILEMDLPPISLHASTQTHNSEINKIKFLQDVGFQRVVFARELSLKQIKEIKESTRIELEAFIHGALCVSYSGQCYFSQAITGRSANRGTCAQPCRSAYNLVDENGDVLAKNKHLLSLKDLNQTENISELITAGVTSLKIEGRLKDIDYVKNITSHYRQIIDEFLTEKKAFKKASSGKIRFNFSPDPAKTFNRGYTTLFSKGRQSGMASLNTQKSIGKFIGEVVDTSSSWFSLKTSELISNNDGLCFFSKKGILTGFKVNKVEGSKVFPNQPMDIYKGAKIYRNFDHQFNSLLLKDNSAYRQIECEINIVIDSNSISIQLIDADGIISEINLLDLNDKAINQSVLLLGIENQIKKTGNTFYKITEVNTEIVSPEIPFITIGQINLLRRNLLEKHSIARVQNHNMIVERIKPNNLPYPEKTLTYKANISNSLALKFYQRHGVENAESAFELQKNYSSKDIMDTKYCLLFELGYCNGNKSQEFVSKKMFLQDNDRQYPLVFNCNDCKMVVKFD